ncbi:MAG: phage antirepressor N-terminal domain-containing protein [Bacteroidota bacterium]|nr:phage antirepressor N-terminal domain-containing protein [Bacteroidota bacterium]MDX5428465.1 phage antirepressor N-terminal domain-containing protein [Bacteroidota bacterium]
MNTHQKFLQFNGRNIVFLNADGTYWIALKPILEALNLESGRYLKRTKRDPFFQTCVDNMSIQVGENGYSQGRLMTCLPEKYIYGWICFLNADSKELNEYKRSCYELLYNHFHGTITNRKELLLQRSELDNQILELKKSLKQEDEKYKSLQELQNKRKMVSTQLNSIDKELIKQPELF